jgi:hypothetical protein
MRRGIHTGHDSPAVRDRPTVTIGSISGVSARPVDRTPAIRRRGRPLRTLPRPGTRPMYPVLKEPCVWYQVHYCGRPAGWTAAAGSHERQQHTSEPMTEPTRQRPVLHLTLMMSVAVLLRAEENRGRAARSHSGRDVVARVLCVHREVPPPTNGPGEVTTRAHTGLPRYLALTRLPPSLPARFRQAAACLSPRRSSR